MTRGQKWGTVAAVVFAVLWFGRWKSSFELPTCATGDYDCRYTGFLMAIHSRPPLSTDIGILVIPSRRAIDLTFAHLVTADDPEAAFLANVLSLYPKPYKPMICSPEHVATLNRRIAATQYPWMRDELVEAIRGMGCAGTLHR